MDYTGENNDRWDIWIPECGGNAHEVDDSAKDAMKSLAFMVSGHERKDYTITEYVNDITRENEEVLVEINHRGRITTSYTYGTSRESVTTASDTQYYLYDGQGNVSRMSSEWGRIKETYTYDPYGNLTYGIPDTVNYYGYNGESANLATGLQYLRARYYNPRTGSFITEDTYAGQATNPLSLNRYDYVSNNPLNYNDPSGHSAFSKWASNAWDSVTGAFQRGYELQQQAQQIETDARNQLVSNISSSAANAVQSAVNKVTTGNREAAAANNKVKEAQCKQLLGLKDNVSEKVQQHQSVMKQVNDANAAVTQALCDFSQTEYGKQSLEYIGLTTLNFVVLGVLIVPSGGATAVPLMMGIAGAASGALAGGSMEAESSEESIYNATKSMYESMMYAEILSLVPTAAAKIGASVIGGAILSEASLETLIDALYALKDNGNLSAESILAMFGINMVTSGPTPAKQVDALLEKLRGTKVGGKIADVIEKLFKGGSKTIDDIIADLPETTNGKGVARNFESTGGFEQALKDFDSLGLNDVKEIQTQYGTGKVGYLSDGTTVVVRPGSKTGGATLEIRISNNKVYKIRY